MKVQEDVKIFSYDELAEVMRDNMGQFFGMVRYPYQDNTLVYQSRAAALSSIHPNYVMQICAALVQKNHGKVLSVQTLDRIQELLMCHFNDPCLFTEDNRRGINYLILELWRAEDELLAFNIYLKHLLPTIASAQLLKNDQSIKNDLQYFIDNIVHSIRHLAIKIVGDNNIDRLLRYEVSALALKFFPMADSSNEAIKVREFEYVCRGSFGISYWTKQFNLNNNSENATRLFLSLMAASHNSHDYPNLRLKCRNLVAGYPSIMEDLEALQWQDAMNWDLTH
jgi:hypothetical protein